MDLVDSLAGRTSFIVGSAKNAGKTTFLKLALSRLRPRGAVGFLTIGVDGEEKDLVFQTPKPRIRAERGDLLLTSDRMLRASELGWELLDAFPGTTVLGRLLLCRVLRGGTVELCGPENNSRLGPVLSALRERGARTILVDGAVDRVTQVASVPGAGLVYVGRVDPARLGAARDSLRLLHALSSVPGPEGLPEEGVVSLPGALTRDRLAALAPSAKALLLEDMTKVFLSWREWKAAASRLDIRFRTRLELLFFCAVLQDLSRDDFFAGLEPALRARILPNPYEAAIS